MIVSTAIVIAVVLAVPALARASTNRAPASTTVAAFAPVAAVLAAVVTITVAIVFGWPAIFPAVPAALLLGWQLPRGRPRFHGRPSPAPPAVSAELRILSLNALVGRASAAAICAEVSRLSPDVLTIQELTPDLVQQLIDEDLTDLLPHSELDALPGPRGIGVWSRWPIVRRPPVADTRRPMPVVELDLAVPVTMTLVHPDSPRRGRHKLWRNDLSRLLASLDAVSGHHLLVGDFNASRDMKQFRMVLAAGFADCADVAASRQWPGFTWPANHWFPPLLRLDHILVSRTGLAVRECRRVRVAGTDHLGLFAVIEPCLGGPVATSRRQPTEESGELQ